MAPWAGRPGNKAVSTNLSTPSPATPISFRWLTTFPMTQKEPLADFAELA